MTKPSRDSRVVVLCSTTQLYPWSEIRENRLLVGYIVAQLVEETIRTKSLIETDLSAQSFRQG